MKFAVNSVPKWSELAQEMTFSGIDKLPFGYFKVPLGNNQDSESPLGASVFSRAVEHIQEADRRYSQINWEYESKETAVQHCTEPVMKKSEHRRTCLSRQEKRGCTGQLNIIQVWLISLLWTHSHQISEIHPTLTAGIIL